MISLLLSLMLTSWRSFYFWIMFKIIFMRIGTRTFGKTSTLLSSFLRDNFHTCKVWFRICVIHKNKLYITTNIFNSLYTVRTYSQWSKLDRIVEFLRFFLLLIKLWLKYSEKNMCRLRNISGKFWRPLPVKRKLIDIRFVKSVW